MCKVLVPLMMLGVMLFCFSGNVYAEKPVSVWIIGDSTACNYPEKLSPRTGWGQTFGTYFGNNVLVRNEAVSGRSTKSFIDEGLFDKVMKEIKPGDYLLIQFGHNDEKKEDSLRYAEANTAYKDNLKMFIEKARGAGALPVLITPIERRSFKNGISRETHGEYPKAMIETGKETKTPVIDITAKSRALYQQLGEEGTKKLFLILDKGVNPNYPNGAADNTHLQTAGAMEIGRLVVEGLNEAKVPLAKLAAAAGK